MSTKENLMIALTTLDEERDGKPVRYLNGELFTPSTAEKGEYFRVSGYARKPTEDELRERGHVETTDAPDKATNRQSNPVTPGNGSADKRKGYLRRDVTAR